MPLSNALPALDERSRHGRPSAAMMREPSRSASTTAEAAWIRSETMVSTL